MRQRLVAGNWKMHGSRASVDQLIDALLAAPAPASVEVVVCPTYVHLAQVITASAGSGIGVGGQGCSAVAAGAYTGEVAAPMLADLGCQWVILGHSERRQYHAESDADVASKLAAAVEAGLAPIVCVGETREQREADRAEAVVQEQLAGALKTEADLASLVIAYEPVWAIGTGLTASPEQAQAMHRCIRDALAGQAGVDAQATRILYGGSVKPDNAGELFAQADIDGALVGGAALKAEDFQAIVAAAASV
ncbi:MAG: triose-phosphate isomerase [Pseudomonadota bacterium]